MLFKWWWHVIFSFYTLTDTYVYIDKCEAIKYFILALIYLKEKIW